MRGGKWWIAGGVVAALGSASGLRADEKPCPKEQCKDGCAKPTLKDLGAASKALVGLAGLMVPSDATPAVPGVAKARTAKSAVDTKPAAIPATHEQVAAIDVKGKHGGAQTLTLHRATGQAVAIAGPGRYDRASKAGKSELVVIGADLKIAKRWETPFVASAVCCTPAGEILAAGSGKLARYTIDGKELAVAELPFVAEMMKDAAGLKKKAEAQRDQRIKSFEAMVKNFEKQIAKAKPGEAEKVQKIKFKDEDGEEVSYSQPSLKDQLKQYQSMLAEAKKQPVDELVAQMAAALTGVNSVSCSAKHVVVVTSTPGGSGYSAWRMGHDLSAPKKILTNLTGCCGQMDIHCCEDALFVAENCKHGVGKFDYEGKRLASFGKRGRNGDGDEFGGCCNPMNVSSAGGGDIFTSESEGFVKRFDASGKFVANVGRAALKGGCKNVALAASVDGKRVFFCDQPGSRVIVLEAKAPAKAKVIAAAE